MKNSHLVGKAEEFVTVLEANAPALTAAGVVVKDIVKDIAAQKDVVVTKSAERDGLQTAAKDKTAEVNEAATALYDAFSSASAHQHKVLSEHRAAADRRPQQSGPALA